MIAISYRREDSSPVTGRLFDRLQAEFGRRNVFMDFDSIPFGVDFRDKIKITLEKARVVVAVVGPAWMGNREGKRRIDDPTDFVRIEIAAALQRGIPVIPVLLDNTVMPGLDELPEELRPFAFRNALVLNTGVDFHHHADRLIAGIHEIVHGRPIRKQKTGWLLPAAMIVASGLIAGAVWWAVSRSNVQSVTNAAMSPAPRATEAAVPRATANTAPAVPAPVTATAAPTVPATIPSPSLPAATAEPSAAIPVTVRDPSALLSFTPANFTRIAPRASNSSRTIINDRFQSADGLVQFALTAIRVGDLAPTIDARRIAIPRLEGETIIERTPSRDSSLFHEDATVVGPHQSYTRYFAVDVPWSSTSGVAASRLWEFWVRDERALQKYKEIYRDFKSRTKFP
jgi:hypothetical protein